MILLMLTYVVNAFKNRLNKHWANEELQYNYCATLNTGNWKT